MGKRKPLFSTTVGKKILSALTGLFLSVFLVGHLAGNLLIFPGQGEWITKYGNFLGALPTTLFVEFALYALILGHAYMGFRVWRENKAARPQEYAVKDWTSRGKLTSGPHKSRKSISSTTMAVSGMVMLLFIAAHTIHFRIGKYNYPLTQSTSANAVATKSSTRTVDGKTVTSGSSVAGAKAEHKGEDLARLINDSFQNIWVVIAYVLSMVAVALHLNHGFASAFQSIGVAGYSKVWPWVGRVFTAVVMGGFIVIPIWVYFFRR